MTLVKETSLEPCSRAMVNRGCRGSRGVFDVAAFDLIKRGKWRVVREWCLHHFDYRGA